MLQKCKTMSEFRQVHAQMIKTNLVNHTFTVSKLIAFSSLSSDPCGLDYALSVFRGISSPNFFIYFSLIKGFSGSLCPLESVILYCRMLCDLDVFDGIEISLPSVLKACGRLNRAREGQQVHGQIMKTHFKFDPFVLNALIRMYSELGQLGWAREVFDKMPSKDVVSWNSMILGYLKMGEIDLACELFVAMPERDLVSCNAMIDAYGKCGRCELAQEVFDMMSTKDVISWTSLISGYVINGLPNKALDLFRKMLASDVQPDAPAIVNVLSAVADLGFIKEGKWLHNYATANGISLGLGFIASSLIDMYSKCGYIEDAKAVFKSICYRRNVGDWNSMISGLAIHGLGQEAISVFLEMQSMGIKPDEVTFVGLLTACAHGGLVNEGKIYFGMMQQKYNIVPRIQHYGCIVDLLGRAGHVKGALEVIQNMPMEPDALAWKAILTASIKHGEYAVGEIAALKAINLAPKDSSPYVLLSNIYAKLRKWENVARIRSIMKEKGVRKVPGCSSVSINDKVHKFLVGKQVGARENKMVLAKVEEMICELKLEGYEPDLSQVLLDAEEGGKEVSLSLHSEKLAIAFALLNNAKGAPIHVMKNLRICCDCHSFIKLVSKVYNCQITVRDPNRFHHFKNGSCSCNDYW